MKLFLPFLLKCCLLITVLYFVLELFFSQTTVLIIINLITISFLFINYYQAIHFNNWLDKSKNNELPNGLGIWEMIFSKMYKQNQVQTKIQNDLNLTLEQFTSAAEAMLDGVIAVNKDDEVIWCNQQAEVMLKINLKKSYKRPIGYTFRNTEFNDYLLKGDYSQTSTVRAAKRLTRSIIDFYLDGRRLNSRELYRQYKSNAELVSRDEVSQSGGEH